MAATAGAAAAGHEVTASAAIAMLDEGGNAFDAALAALCASCVAEPVLASLGGGGFLLARRVDQAPIVYDFFCQTPLSRNDAASTDFYPIVADFGDAQQEFHIGFGSMATPGVIRGLFLVHRELCRLPMDLIVAPAVEAARQGVLVNRLQHYISQIIQPILRATPGALALHASTTEPNALAGIGERLRQPDMAASLEALAHEGEDLFYRGALGEELVKRCRQGGGHLRGEDLDQYRVYKRAPLALDYRGARLFTNPAPSLGGSLIGVTLDLLSTQPLGDFGFGSLGHIRLLARAMRLTQDLRSELGTLPAADSLRQAHWERLLGRYRGRMHEHPPSRRGTTQISVADGEGNLASLTLSNGEGSGYVIPGSGIMVNNMLGEEDINPAGFHRWPLNRRMASMMAPSLLIMDTGQAVATGSGGSNRIRSAILQVVSNLVDFSLPLEEAVSLPRIHYESGLLNLEPDRDPSLLAALQDEFPNQILWNDLNLFFGGAHSVMRHADGSLEGTGDPRRGGISECSRA